MKIISRHLGDVLILEPTSTQHDFLSETSISKQDLQGVGIHTLFVQDNHSRSVKNVLRGLHYQIKHPQGKLIRVAAGSIFDVAVDLRRGSLHFGQSASFELSAQSGYLAWIPAGFAHGFLVTSESADVLYSVTDYRNTEHERTLFWNDPALAIDWPLMGSHPILSEKDHVGTSFLRADLYDYPLNITTD